MPANVTLIWLPSRSPELNSVENVWQSASELALQSRLR
jgi:transposase